MTEKKVYVIMGSEDGVIGVATNLKAAYRIAHFYVSGQSNGNNDEVLLDNKKATYTEVSRQMKASAVTLEAGTSSYGITVSADIAIMPLVSK